MTGFYMKHKTGLILVTARLTVIIIVQLKEKMN